MTAVTAVTAVTSCVLVSPESARATMCPQEAECWAGALLGLLLLAAWLRRRRGGADGSREGECPD